MLSKTYQPLYLQDLAYKYVAKVIYTHAKNHDNYHFRKISLIIFDEL